MSERPSPHEHVPRKPFELPSALAEFFNAHAAHECLCVMQATDQGTAFVARLPRAEIELLHSYSPIGITHELYPLALAPVLRTVVRLYDVPGSYLSLEMFTNVGDEQQASDFAALSTQPFVPLVVYDEWLQHQRTKRVTYSQGAEAAWLLQQARWLYAGITQEVYDFDTAKEIILQRTEL